MEPAFLLSGVRVTRADRLHDRPDLPYARLRPSRLAHRLRAHRRYPGLQTGDDSDQGLALRAPEEGEVKLLLHRQDAFDVIAELGYLCDLSKCLRQLLPIGLRGPLHEQPPGHSLKLRADRVKVRDFLIGWRGDTPPFTGNRHDEALGSELLKRFADRGARHAS